MNEATRNGETKRQAAWRLFLERSAAHEAKWRVNLETRVLNSALRDLAAQDIDAHLEVIQVQLPGIKRPVYQVMTDCRQEVRL